MLCQQHTTLEETAHVTSHPHLCTTSATEQQPCRHCQGVWQHAPGSDCSKCPALQMVVKAGVHTSSTHANNSMYQTH